MPFPLGDVPNGNEVSETIENEIDKKKLKRSRKETYGNEEKVKADDGAMLFEK